MHFNNELIFIKYAKSHFFSGAKVLEIGSHGSPTQYQSLANDESLDWYSLDLEKETEGSENSKFIHAEHPYKYPIKDNSFDIIFSGGVMCNVGEVWTWMQELKRIVKPGGLIITITPVSYPYANAPIDCWRIYPDGMKAVNNFLHLETIFCETESLELDYFGYSEALQNTHNIKLPYVSVTGFTYAKTMTSINKHKMLWNKLISRIPGLRRYMNPVHYALDTICVARKNT